MSDNNGFRNRLDDELKELVFSEVCKERVLAEVVKPKNKLRALLDREILIPVKPFAAAVFIVAAAVVYSLTAAFAVSSHDIEKSRIVVVNEADGGHKDNVYKN